MTFTPDFCKANILVDMESEILYGAEQMNVSFPIRFPTVNIPLRDMGGLYDIADKIRMKLDHLPMLPQTKDADEEDYDADGWYDFYVGIKRLPDGDKLDSCICFTVDSCASDDGQEYIINLSAQEQENVYAALNASVEATMGKSCSSMLDEAQKEMEC